MNGRILARCRKANLGSRLRGVVSQIICDDGFPGLFRASEAWISHIVRGFAGSMTSRCRRISACLARGERMFRPACWGRGLRVSGSDSRSGSRGRSSVSGSRKGTGGGATMIGPTPAVR